MKNKKIVFLVICNCLWLLGTFAQCTTGCTTTVSTTTASTVNYPVPAGQTLCITPTGKITGTITLTGGTICNQGIIQASSLTASSGTINNYGTLQPSSITVSGGTINNYGYMFQLGNLQLSGASILNNYNFIEVQAQFLLASTAKYVSQNAQAILWVYRFSTTLTSNANAPHAKLSNSMDGGAYLTSDGFLYFQYDEEYTAGTFQYKVYNNNRTLVMSNATNALSAKIYGDNRYALKVGCVLPLGDYVMEVTTDKNEVSYLRFKVNVLQYCP